MMNIKILDCTLRDGGYINDWNFTNHQIRNILTSLGSSNVDIVECGYLDDKKGNLSNSTLFSKTDTVDKLINSIDNDIQKREKVVMINFGDFDVSNLSPCYNTSINGIRLAFHKKDIDSALDMASNIIELGYKLYLQPMVTKNYTDMEFLSIIEKANLLDIHSFYIVDSFGSMTLEEFQRYMTLADNNLKPDVSLGYHSHNNMQLAFSNAINMANTNLNRDIIIDASIYGIGRGAGNLNTELITDYLNNVFNKSYKILPLLEIIDEFLNSLMKKNPWGFSPAQYLSASFNCHPNYATYLINKNTNHIVGVHKVLKKLKDEQKVSFNESLIEKLYIDSLLEVKIDTKGTFSIPTDKKILLVASGKSVKAYEEIINKKLKDDNYLVVALNHKPVFECDYYFFSNQKRFDEFNNILVPDKIIITNNISIKIDLEIVLDFKKLAYTKDKFIGNVAIVAINFLVSQNITKVEIVGLDGYSYNNDNYNYKEDSVITDSTALLEQNNLIASGLNNLKNNIDIVFITPSIFKEKVDKC